MHRDTHPAAEVKQSPIRLSEIEKKLCLTCLVVPSEDLEITTGFASDVLSDVLGSAARGSLLVTTQYNANVLAVAAHIHLAAVIYTSGRRPEADQLTKARKEGIGLFSTEADTFEVVGRLFELGIRGQSS